MGPAVFHPLLNPLLPLLYPLLHPLPQPPGGLQHKPSAELLHQLTILDIENVENLLGERVSDPEYARGERERERE